MDEKIKIIPLTYAQSVMSENKIVVGGDEELLSPISFTIYLLVVGDRRILVDTGCKELSGYIFYNYKSPMECLRSKGFLCEDITDIIVTHAHHDHIACARYFPNATIHIQKDEYIVGRKYIPNSASLNIFEENWSICSNIHVKKIGGHSIGSCVLLVEGDKKKYLLCGDEVYTSACVERQLPTGSSYNMENSRAFLEKYGQGDYEILYFHDIKSERSIIAVE